MTLVTADRVKDTTTTTGTGTVTLSGSAPSGFQAFGAVMSTNDTCYYAIVGATTEWEVGLGTYNSTGPTLARTTVLASSNAGAAVNFSAGTKGVFLDLPARQVSDIRAGLAAASVNPSITNTGFCVPGFVGSTQGTGALSANTDYYLCMLATSSITFDQVAIEVTTASGSGGSTARTAITAADASWQPSGSVIEDFGTVANDSTGVKTATPSGGSRTLTPGRYLLLINQSVGATYRRILGGIPGQPIAAGLGASPFPAFFTASRAYGAFSGTQPAWTAAAANNAGAQAFVYLRLTAAA